MDDGEDRIGALTTELERARVIPCAGSTCTAKMMSAAPKIAKHTATKEGHAFIFILCCCCCCSLVVCRLNPQLLVRARILAVGSWSRQMIVCGCV